MRKWLKANNYTYLEEGMEKTYTVPFYNKPLNDKSIYLPGSKSITNRALLLATLARGKTQLTNFLECDDSMYMMKALSSLGLKIDYHSSEKSCEVEGGKLINGDADLYVGNAGTAMRFLTSFLCLGRGHFRIDGDQRMRERPLGHLIDALKHLGCDVRSEFDNDCPPVIIDTEGMPGGQCRISGEVSSQFISSILMSAPRSQKGVMLETIGEVASKPYIDMTVQMMQWFGMQIERENYHKFQIPVGEYFSPWEYPIEPDASAASYFLAAVAILSGKISLQGLGKNSVQGDVGFAEVLQKMGCSLIMHSDSLELESDGHLQGINIDMNSIPDMVPTLAVTALFADSPTTIRNVANLRVKESDRIAAVTTELKKLGAEVEEWEDGMKIIPTGNYTGVPIDTYNDHRIAMSFSVAGLKIEGIEIVNPKCTKKTFPEFYQYLENFILE